MREESRSDRVLGEKVVTRGGETAQESEKGDLSASPFDLLWVSEITSGLGVRRRSCYARRCFARLSGEPRSR